MTNCDLHLGNCIQIMQMLPPESIDLTVTSPPYDDLRNYEGYSFDFESIAKELFRITKLGGVVVWIVNDKTENMSETGTSFKQALFFKKIGFNLFDTMIYAKNGIAMPDKIRYYSCFEYMFVLSKGKPKTFNPIEDRKNKHAGLIKSHRSFKGKDGIKNRKDESSSPIKQMGRRWNIWTYEMGFGKFTTDNYAYEHPAIFPEKLAGDHIKSWSNENDLVLDPMMGSGTVGKMAKSLKRNFIGIETSQKYFDIAQRRCQVVQEILN